MADNLVVVVSADRITDRYDFVISRIEIVQCFPDDVTRYSLPRVIKYAIKSVKNALITLNIYMSPLLNVL